jgi:dTDP-4-dehydrorhamnose 3,5-epimerase
MFRETKLPGVFLVDNFNAVDNRGVFVKTFHQQDFASHGLDKPFRESYYSKSVKNVVRGMHFQLPPFDHEKLVYVTEGEIVDVVLDLRTESPTFKQFVSLRLKAFGSSIFIPKGCAHGFLTLSDSATVIYNVTTVYNQSSDAGIFWNSFGFDWPVAIPILSIRDQSFPMLSEFRSPFL